MATSVAAPFHTRFVTSSLKSGNPCHFRLNANGCKCLHFAENYNPSRSTFRSLRGSSLVSPLALGSNTSQDTDDMYNDEFFKKHGKVVFRRKDQKSLTAEVDDDAECLSFAMALAKVASDVKASDIKVLFVKPLVFWTRFFVIATAFSYPQIDAIRVRTSDLAEEKYGMIANGDTKANDWTLLDFGDVVVHIFLPDTRKFYNLEEFYANAIDDVDSPSYMGK